MYQKKVLVVGTTSDYIHILRQTLPGKVLFLTSTVIRKNAKEPCPDAFEEVLYDNDDHELVIDSVMQHIKTSGQTITGVACFDCESMGLASQIAQALKLPYPGTDAINACRDKVVSKEMWRSNGLNTPRSMKVNSESEAAEFFIRAGCECVLKPVQGSGSEHVFKCSTADKCKEAFREIAKNQASPVAVAEKFIQGTEYSCDFIIDGSKIHLIRIARKLPSDNNVFGTTMGYELIEFLPGNISHTYFISMLEKAAKSVGINRAICMMDFIVRGSMIYILELAPRPGGDCLPWLIEKAMGLDILALTINFVQQKPYIHIKPESFSPMIGLRIHAQKPGILKKIDITGLQADSRVRDVYIKRENGDIIVIPPADYDSWNLGHAIFKPYRFVELEKQCKDLLSLVTIEMENRNDIQYNGIQKAG